MDVVKEKDLETVRKLSVLFETWNQSQCPEGRAGQKIFLGIRAGQKKLPCGGL